MLGWWARGVTTEVVLNAAMWRSWFSRIRQGCLGRQSVKAPKLLTPKGRPARPLKISGTARVSQKKAHQQRAAGLVAPEGATFALGNHLAPEGRLVWAFAQL